VLTRHRLPCRAVSGQPMRVVCSFCGRRQEEHPTVAGELPADDASVDAVLLLGPLYHLVDRADRLAALHEAQRVLRPGGRIVAEAICRHAWVLDATVKGLLDSPAIWDPGQTSAATGRHVSVGAQQQHDIAGRGPR
jgi:SAM-dependent methyltransferase